MSSVESLYEQNSFLHFNLLEKFVKIKIRLTLLPPSNVPCSAPVSESVCITSVVVHFPSGLGLQPLH